MSKDINYNTDCTKHFVRHYGWTGAYRTIKNFVDRQISAGTRKERCKYLTFCAVQAIDVFMLEKHKYLYRDPTTNRLTNVFFFENDEDSYSLITKMIGSDKQGFYGDFNKVILQNLTKEFPAITSEEFDEPETEQEREIIRLKELKKTLVEIFPFDVINLDLYGNFFPNQEQRFSESCQAYRHVLELQKDNTKYECKRFLMFLTVYTPITISHINADAFNNLQRTIFENLSHDRFRETFEEKFKHTNPLELEFYLRFIIGFTKQMIFRESYQIGWDPTIKDIYCYDRVKPKSGEEYKMTTFVVEYRRSEDLNNTDFAGSIPTYAMTDYLEQLERIIMHQPICVPKVEDISEEVKEDLEQIVEFRNHFLKEIGVFEEKLFT